jgi:pilus assembly protein CpaE
MENRTPVTLIDLDRESNAALTDMLKGMPGIDVTAEAQDFYRGLSLIRRHRPALVILNLYPAEDAALSFARKISQNYPETSLFITAKNTHSALILNAMRVGAREFVSQPVDKEEFTSAVRKALQGRRDSALGNPVCAKVVTVFGTKGGAGATTLAVNLASLLKAGSRSGAAVIDLDLQFGDAALMMSVKARASLVDLAENVDLLDANHLRNLLPRSAGGIGLLAAPGRIEEAEQVTAGHLEKVLSVFRGVFDAVVIDTPHVLNDLSVKAMDESDFVLLTAGTDVPSLHHAGRCIELFRKMGFDREKALLVLNRYGGADDIHPEAVEKLLDYPVSWRLPAQDAETMTDAVTRGIPVSELQPHAKWPLALRRIAEHISGVPAQEKCRRRVHPPMAFIQKLIG